MKNVKILLAGPGTGKTTKVKKEVKRTLEEDASKKILVVSFTNATVKDLLTELAPVGINDNSCMTLHSLAMRLNHSTNKHILDRNYEEKFLQYYASQLDISFDALCKLLNCVTYEQMIVDCVAFIKTNPAYVKEKLGELDLLIVDEYQDFNPAERELIFSIMEYAEATFILGDDDQCIYGFKNADSEGIISLFEHVDTIKVEHENICYRCPKDVVIAGNKLIQKNTKRVRKEWKVHNTHDGLKHHQTNNQDETNTLVIEELQKILTDDPASTVMVLSRARFVVNPIIEHAKSKGMDAVNWWQDKAELEVMDQIWWLRLIFSNYRFLNVMFLLRTRITRKNKAKIMELLAKRLKHGDKEESVIKEITDLGLLDGSASKFIFARPAQEVFFDELKDFETFKELLGNADLEKLLPKLTLMVSEKVEFEKGKVNFMSIYKSKGLQADHVLIVGMVEGILPNESSAVDSLEAQRRLFFVALSRARKSLLLFSQLYWLATDLYKGRADIRKFTRAGRLLKKGEASLFIRELN